MDIKIAPSIFASDFYNIKKAVETIESAGADMIHYDVMDNHFAPNISFGPKFISDVSSKTKLASDVHLMIDLDKRFQPYLELAIESVTIHLESAGDGKLIAEYIDLIKTSGKKAGISIKPKTPVESIIPYLDTVDLILVMSVEPGFSGQAFIPDSLKKIQKIKGLIEGKNVDLQVDGGVCRQNYKDILNHGANFLVIGSAFFKDKNAGEWVRDIKYQ